MTSPAPAAPLPAVRALLSAPEAAAALGVATPTLAKWRVTGAGPRFVKLGARVLYDAADLDAWVSARRVASTSDRRGRAA